MIKCPWCGARCKGKACQQHYQLEQLLRDWQEGKW